MLNDKEIARLVLNIDAEIGNAKERLQEVSKNVEALGTKFKGTGKEISIFKEIFKGILAAQAIFHSAQRIFNSLLGDSIHLYIENARALSYFKTNLGYTSTALIKYSKELSSITATEESVIISIFSTLAAFTKQEEAIKKLTPVIIDFARAHRDMSPEGAAQLFAKAIFTNVNALARYGIKLHGAIGSQERINEAIRKTTALWGNLSEEFAKTDIGILDTINVKINSIKESIGKKLIPYQIRWKESLLSIYQFVDKIFTKIELFGLTKEQKEIYRQVFDVIPSIQDLSLRKAAYVKILGELGREEGKILEKIPLRILENRKLDFGMIYSSYFKQLDFIENLRKKINEEFLKETLKISTLIEEEDIKETKKNTAIVLEDYRLFEEQMRNYLLELDTAYKNNELTIEEYYKLLKIAAETSFYKQIELLEKYKNKLIEKNELEEASKAAYEIDLKKAQLTNRLKELEIEYSDAINKRAEETKKVNLQLIDEYEKVKESFLDVSNRIFLETLSNRERELQELEMQYKKDLEIYIKYEEDTTKLKEYYSKKRDEIERRYEEDRRKRIEEASLYISKTLIDAWDTFYDVQINNLNRQKENELEYVKYSITNKEKQEQEFNRINTKYEAEARKIAEKKRRLAILEATIDMFTAAVGAYKSFASIPYVGTVLGAAAAAAALTFGAAKIAAIASAHYYKGGKVHGKEGRDCVPAYLTAGEYVHTRETVNYYGDQVMEAINRRLVPKDVLLKYKAPVTVGNTRYAAGGYVSNSPNEIVSLQINNIVDPTLIAKYLTSSQGQKVILNVIYDNQYNIKRTLQI